MDARILVGTESGLWQLRGDALEPVDQFTARTVTALARSGQETWAIVDGRALWHSAGGQWNPRASLDDRPATCLAAAPNGLLIGTAQAHLLRFLGDTLEPVESFDTVEGREEWHTPWGSCRRSVDRRRPGWHHPRQRPRRRRRALARCRTVVGADSRHRDGRSPGDCPSHPS